MKSFENLYLLDLKQYFSYIYMVLSWLPLFNISAQDSLEICSDTEWMIGK